MHGIYVYSWLHCNHESGIICQKATADKAHTLSSTALKHKYGIICLFFHSFCSHSSLTNETFSPQSFLTKRSLTDPFHSLFAFTVYTVLFDTFIRDFTLRLKSTIHTNNIQDAFHCCSYRPHGHCCHGCSLPPPNLNWPKRCLLGPKRRRHRREQRSFYLLYC